MSNLTKYYIAKGNDQQYFLCLDNESIAVVDPLMVDMWLASEGPLNVLAAHLGSTFCFGVSFGWEAALEAMEDVSKGDE